MSKVDTQLLGQKTSMRPILDPKDVIELVKEYYGFTVVQISELDGYDDKNYHIQVEQNYGNHRAEGYVFKVINRSDSAHPEIFEAQTLLLIHLGKDFKVFVGCII